MLKPGFFSKSFYFIKRRLFLENYKFSCKIDLPSARRDFKKTTLWCMYIVHIRGVNSFLKVGGGGQVMMRRAAAAWRRLLFFQNMGGQLPPMPPLYWRPCIYNIMYFLQKDDIMLHFILYIWHMKLKAKFLPIFHFQQVNKGWIIAILCVKAN